MLSRGPLKFSLRLLQKHSLAPRSAVLMLSPLQTPRTVNISSLLITLRLRFLTSGVLILVVLGLRYCPSFGALISPKEESWCLRAEPEKTEARPGLGKRFEIMPRASVILFWTPDMREGPFQPLLLEFIRKSEE